MVREILGGRKTQTRLVAKEFRDDQASILKRFPRQRCCPYGDVGDLLWVRETFKRVASGQVCSGYGEIRHGIAYQADGHVQWDDHVTKIYDLTGQPDSGPVQFKEQPWKPAIHIRRHESRIMLEITEVRVQRLQEISEADAEAEGVEPLLVPPDGGSAPHVEGYIRLWDSLNAKRGYGWDANPWVWAITFRQVERAFAQHPELVGA